MDFSFLFVFLFFGICKLKCQLNTWIENYQCYLWCDKCQFSYQISDLKTLWPESCLCALFTVSTILITFPLDFRAFPDCIHSGCLETRAFFYIPNTPETYPSVTQSDRRKKLTFVRLQHLWAAFLGETIDSFELNASMAPSIEKPFWKRMTHSFSNLFQLRNRDSFNYLIIIHLHISHCYVKNCDSICTIKFHASHLPIISFHSKMFVCLADSKALWSVNIAEDGLSLPDCR